MIESNGFAISIAVPSGEPDGLRVIEKSNWDGKGLIFPRAYAQQVSAERELQNAGVYILWGPSESSQLPRVYVGESDSPSDRIKQHDAGTNSKPFWTHGAVFTSESLNKAHIQYLEARLVRLANDVKRCELDNENIPSMRSLSRSNELHAKGFLSDMLLCLPLVGVSFFEIAQVPAFDEATRTDESQPNLEDTNLLFLKDEPKNVDARGFNGAEFIVLAGSTAAKDETPSLVTYKSEVVAQRTDLVKLGVLTDKGQVFEFAQNYAFNSPSRAACVVLGMSANGLDYWKDAKGRSIKQLKDSL
jgi:hypothetical protein